MITSLLYFNNALGSSLTINDDIYPLARLEQSMPNKVEYIDRPYTIGSHPAKRWHAPRLVTLEGAILATDADDLNTKRRNLIKYFTAHDYTQEYQGYLQGVFDNVASGGVIRLLADAVGMPEVAYSGLSPGYAEFQVNLIANDPEWYTITQTAQTYTSPGSGSFTVNGDLPVFPRIRITGPQTNPAVTVGDCSFYWTSLTLTAGQYVEIDFRKRTFIANNSTVLSSALTNLTGIGWGQIGPGSTGYSWTASTSSTGRELKIDYNPSWAV